jgi:hypothetical protein
MRVELVLLGAGELLGQIEGLVAGHLPGNRSPADVVDQRFI